VFAPPAHLSTERIGNLHVMADIIMVHVVIFNVGNVVSVKEIPLKLKAFVPQLIGQILLFVVFVLVGLVCAEYYEGLLDKSHCDQVVPLLHRELELPVHTDSIRVLTDKVAVEDSI